ncbi:GAF domain-containing protein [Cohnella fermenti]|uniref:GAF domain-containing protein n=1 Tax=Cohnella fermenti TaxID=2565925 RepID=A0A4S4BY28_9BACL|nr:GAF domain-containing protein [Cohnella fermenti]THF78042.1 GAF domain-containing protein [Cohnella fermenti]
MVLARESVERELSALRELLEVDVAAVSWKRARDRQWEWWAASGCRDERFRTLSIRMGRGIEGTVPRIGRSLVIDVEHPNGSRQREESALMHVEQLMSAIACPILVQDVPQGVLLAGTREDRVFSREQLQRTQLAAAMIGQWAEDAQTALADEVVRPTDN